MRVRVRVIDLKTGEEKNIDIEKEKTNVGISLQTCSSPPQRDRPKGFVRLFFSAPFSGEPWQQRRVRLLVVLGM